MSYNHSINQVKVMINRKEMSIVTRCRHNFARMQHIVMIIVFLMVAILMIFAITVAADHIWKAIFRHFQES